VVPLAGLTLYSYWTSIRAFRNVVQEESATLAKEMSHRMEVVTRDLQDRIHQLDRRPFYQLGAEGKDKVNPAEVYAHVLSNIGDMAAYIDTLEFPAAPPPPGPVGEGQVPEAPPGAPPPGAAGHPDLSELQKGLSKLESVVVHLNKLNDRLALADPGTLAARIERVKNRIILQCAELEANHTQTSGKPPSRADEYRLTEQQIREIKAEAKRLSRGAGSNVQDAVSVAPAWRNPVDQQKKADELGTTVELTIRQPGEKPLGTGEPRPIRARIRAAEVLARIFEPRRFDHGEIQFAVDSAGTIHTPDPGKVDQLEELGLCSTGSQPASAQSCPEDWIVATAVEPVSGMTFGIARPIRESLQEIRSTALRNLGVGMGFIGLALLGVIPLSGRMTRNLSTLTRGVERLSGGDLEARVPIRSKNEFGALAAAFNKMASDLAEQQKRLVEQERLQKELEMCRRIQEVLLPREPLNVGFAEARGISIPARQVGGDFFNYFVLPEGDVAVLMGDVSGKGVPAALLMANLQARLQARLQVERNLARLAQEIDIEISRQTEPWTFATLFMGIISHDGKVLKWVNAGHNPQFVLRADGQVRKLYATGKPVGLLPGDGFEEHQVKLSSGDFLFLYTDGLVEAENPEGEEFGTERLEAVLMEERTLDVGRILNDVVEAVKTHRAGTEAGDDATLLALKVSTDGR
ncbi:MAG TPA: SpoIIE family protein phosphatase, partial [Acidobacteriota bacterium]|nr:SpoIIE family protein phosphatase [Acidobacteriota bacterium]